MFKALLADAIDTAEIALHEVEQTVSSPTSAELGATFIKMLLTFVAIIFLLFASYWFLKRLIQSRMQRGPSNSAIHVLEKRMLSPKTILYLVEIEGKKVVLAESHLEIKKVESFPTESACTEYPSSSR
jgi:flagellar biogenesis protein FliO